jgi:hypothetical protein
MSVNIILSQFSKNRLNGELVPEDLQILLVHRDEFAARTGLELNEEADWAPWLDTSYLSEQECANPDIAANLRASEEVCRLIAFVAAEEDGQFLGYWRGPSHRPVAKSPLVLLDNEGQFNLSAGSTFAEAVLARLYDPEQFTELRDWLRSLGIAIRSNSPDDLFYPEGELSPGRLHEELFYRYRG